MLTTISKLIWGIPTMVFILGTGLWLSVKLSFVQLFELKTAIKSLFKSNSEKSGEIAPAKALMTALSATIGTGNIAGVATALTIGGPGAIFWMWITALIGMATKYSEAYFAVKFREKKNNEFFGGPMYFIKNGLGKNWHFLATAFAIFGGVAGFGIGNAVQVNTIAKTINNIASVPELTTGLSVALVVGFVLLGGIKRIANFASKIVPFMSITYLLVTLYCLSVHAQAIIPTFLKIIEGAFSAKSISGGLAGSGMLLAMRMGIARGIFSNEAGLGSAAIAHAAAKTENPHQQGLIAMTGVLIDTIILCTITALVILTSGVQGFTGAVLTEQAVRTSINFGDDIVGACLCFFAFTSIISWSYYSERCVFYLFGEKSTKIFRTLWVIFIPLGAIIKQDEVWLVSDIFNALMAYPNLIALMVLSRRYY